MRRWRAFYRARKEVEIYHVLAIYAFYQVRAKCDVKHVARTPPPTRRVCNAMGKVGYIQFHRAPTDPVVSPKTKLIIGATVFVYVNYRGARDVRCQVPIAEPPPEVRNFRLRV